MARKTGQYPSQYRHALHITNWRLASWNTSSPGIRRCLSPREFSEHGTDCQSKAAKISLCENVARHDFSSRVDVRKWPAALIKQARSFIHGNSHVCERNARAQWKPVKRRTIDWNCPIAFWRRDTAGAGAVQDLDANLGVRGRRAIIFRDCLCEHSGIESQGDAQRLMRIGLIRFEHGWQEALDGFRIHSAKCRLFRLRGDQASRAGVSLRPDVFSFVRESTALLIDDNPKRNRVEPCNNAAVKFRRARVHRNSVKSFRIANCLRSFFQESGKQHSVVVWCAADDEIVRRVSPVLLEPFDVGFVAPGGHHNRAGPDELFGFSALEPYALASAIFNDNVLNHGVVTNADSHATRRLIVGIQKRLSSSEEPSVGSSQVERTGERLLPAHTVRAHPLGKLARFSHRQLGEIEIGRLAGHANKVLQMLLFGIWAREKLVGGGMCAAYVSRVARVSTAHMFRSALEHQDSRAGVARCQCPTQGGVAASDYDDAVLLHRSCSQERSPKKKL